MKITVPTARPEIFHGLLGELVEIYGPHTEAASIAIAAQHLVLFGNAVGRGPGFDVGETRHHLNENLLLVGSSSRARKGDSANIALKPLRDADPDWASRIASGLSSGEGLIHAVRDATYTTDEKGKQILRDDGNKDKRLPVIETEFSSALKQFNRKGNVLSNIIRDAWDCKPVLRTLTRHSPMAATGAHISIIAHITPQDLLEHLTATDVANGLGNRFIFIVTGRARELPNPGRADPGKVAALVGKVRAALDFAGGVQEIRRDERAERLWSEIYGELTRDQPGLSGELLKRSEAHVCRLSALYALYAQSQYIRTEHLKAALALWDYAEDSVRIIFRRRTGRQGADRIMSDMAPGQTLNLTEIRKEIFSNHVAAGALTDDLELLRDLGFVRLERKETAGRPETLITRLEDPAEELQGSSSCAKSAESAISPPPAGGGST